MPQKKLASESHAGTSSLFQFLTRFLHGEKMASQSLKNTRFGRKVFYFVRKPSWGISEPPGGFCIEQAQQIIGGLKSAPWRCGLFPFLVMQGQPSHGNTLLQSPAAEKRKIYGLESRFRRLNRKEFARRIFLFTAFLGLFGLKMRFCVRNTQLLGAGSAGRPAASSCM